MYLSGPFSIGSTSSQLIRDAQAQHGQSWSILVDTYAPLIYHLARSAGLQSNDASDITQVVLIQVYKSLCDFKPLNRGSFRKWIKVITKNKIVDLCRLRGDVVVHLLDDDDVEEENSDFEQAQSIVPDERLIRIREIVAEVRASVADSTWEAFESMLAGLETSKAIGERLGMSEASVRLAKHRILAKIQKRLEEEQISGDETI